MHIKQLIVSGFRSFKDQREVEPFSPHHNVIVGRNGSGKSNFFNAIQFVLLAPKFASLRQEDRQNLLHEGAGSSVMAAYVEIVFDNTDGRFPVDGDEVVLRRTVGLKKDEFFLNRRRIDKAEVLSLLEAAGFSKSNPYYIVQQGKVAHLCTMRDADRLDLLKEVAGTTVYEERRAESLKILQDTATKQERIAEILAFIEQRLHELEEEKDELKEYEELDRRRRALEYNMYDKELGKAVASLQRMEQEQETKRARQHELYSALRSAEEQLQQSEEELASLRATSERTAARRDAKATELEDAVTLRSRCEVSLHAAEELKRAQETEVQSLRAELDALSASIRDSEAALEDTQRLYESKNAELAATRERRVANQMQIDTLYGKQGRGRQFSSAKERDAFLKTQIAQLEAQISENTALAASLSAEVKTQQAEVTRSSDSLKTQEAQNRQRVSAIEACSRDIEQKLIQRNSMQERRKQLWRDLETVQEQIADSRNEQSKGRQMLSMTLPRAITMGLAAVERIAEELQLKGYYGPLIDNFTLKNEIFRTSVEVAAGNALFHVVVDNERTAATLMEELERRKAGRLTFLPLNRLQNDRVQYPNSPDVKPLLEVAIDYDAALEPALQHIFGKKLLARDLDTAARFSKEFNLDCVTKDGDTVNRKGGFEGGFHDDRVSRCAAVSKIRAASAKLTDLSQQEKSLNAELESIDTTINALLNDLKKTELDRDNLRTQTAQFSKDISNLRSDVKAAEDSLERRVKSLETLSAALNTSNSQIEMFRKELGSKLSSQLTVKEKDDLNQAETTERDLSTSISQFEDELMQLSSERERLRAHLKSNLQKRYYEIMMQLEVAATGRSTDAAEGASSSKKGKKSPAAEAAQDLTALRLEHVRLSSLVASLESEVSDLEKSLATLTKDISSLEVSVEKHRALERAAEDEMTEASKEQDRMLNKRSLVMDTVNEKQKLLRSLGSVPRKEVEEFKDLDESKLLKKLKDVNERLKKYAAVNRKALDQYVSFNEQRENLIQRRDEIERENGAIQMLIESLDRQKDETILNTFRTVSKHFTDVFDELVPGGHGELIMRTDEESQGDIAGSEIPREDEQGKRKSGGASKGSKAQQAGRLSVNTFQGVMVRVSFSGSGQQYSMEQLSGGQKALVALSLIFAIQRSDPAPFYLFDEIDQALDASYRTGVARLIQRQVQSADSPAQFITTTFRPEMVAAADKCYGIALLNKVSNIYPLDKVDAENFVTNLLTEEEAVGRVSAVPSLARAQRQQMHTDDDDYVGDSYVGSNSRVLDDEEGDGIGLAASYRRGSSVSSAATGLGKRRGGYVRESVSEDEDDF